MGAKHKRVIVSDGRRNFMETIDRIKQKVLVTMSTPKFILFMVTFPALCGVGLSSLVTLIGMVGGVGLSSLVTLIGDVVLN